MIISMNIAASKNRIIFLEYETAIFSVLKNEKKISLSAYKSTKILRQNMQQYHSFRDNQKTFFFSDLDKV